LDITTGSLNAGYLSSIKSGEEYKYISDFKNLWTNISDKEIYSNIYFLNGYNFTNVNNVNVYWINKTIIE
jgi:hypothetical protein